MDRSESLAATPSQLGRFHNNHGKYVQLLDGSTIAERVRSWDHGVVFSETSIPIGTMFQIKLLEKVAGWEGCIALGFTFRCPDEVTVPRVIQSHAEDPKWILVAASSSRDERIFDTGSLRVGQSLGCMVNKKGELHCFIDGEDKGVVRRGVPTNKPLWGFADINAQAKKIKSDYCPSAAKQPSRFSLKFKGKAGAVSQQAAAAEQQLHAKTESKPTLDNQNFPQRQVASLSRQDSQERQVERTATLSKQDPQGKQVQHKATLSTQDFRERKVATLHKQESQRQIELLRDSLDAALLEVEDLTQQRDSAITEAQRQRSAAEESHRQLRVLQQQLNPAKVEQPCSSSATNIQRQLTWKVSRSEVHILGEMTREAWGSVAEGRFQGQRVAVKLPDPDILNDHSIGSLQRDVQIMSQLRHPNLLQFVAAVFDDEGPHQSPLIVTEFLHTNLRTAYQNGRLSNSSKLWIFQDIAYALHYLHGLEVPIIHRNITAPGVLLEDLPNGMWRAKISDFASAHLARPAQTMEEGAFIYAAPETIPQSCDRDSSPPPQTTKVDVYSYGVLLCEVAASEIPELTEYQSLLHHIQNQWLPIYELIVHCTERSPQERPTMAQILDKLTVSHCLPTQSRQTSV